MHETISNEEESCRNTDEQKIIEAKFLKTIKT